MSNPKMTPMVKQYLEIKEQYQDTILFYRMGDFFEMFFEDAKIASNILEIALTSRNKSDADAIPMCGIPVKALDGYLARLINKGYKVAICDQVEDAAAAKGLVKREVVRVVTPGMIIDNELLDAASNNFIMSFSGNNGTIGFSYLDISTGKFRVSESDNLNAILDESKRISPNEIILPESFRENPSFAAINNAFANTALTYIEDKAFDTVKAREMLTDQFNTRSLEGFGCEGIKTGVSAAGALLSYVRETQKQKTEHIAGIETYSLGKYLVIDDTSCRNLELLKNISTGDRRGTLLSIIDKTVTAMGARLLKEWIRYPLIETDRIEERLDAIDEAKNNTQARTVIREGLREISDIERLSSKIVMGRCNARDLLAIKNSINHLPVLWDHLFQFNNPVLNPEEHLSQLDELTRIAALIENSIREDAPPTLHNGGLIKPEYNEALNELIQISRDGKGWIARLEAEEKNKTGINSLKVKYNKVFGYYLEVPNTHIEKVPDNYIRKQTLVNAERYITDALKTFESKVLGAQEQRNSLEFELFESIRIEVMKHHAALTQAARFIARIDCITGFAEVAYQNNYHRPEINNEARIAIYDGRHPVVEKLIVGERYINNSITLDNNDNQILVITGPNMAGKSTILRQVALTVLMAQMGSFVPAAKASICVTDRIFTRVGALDNLSSGQSTFMVEMEETANIMNNATSNSLVILDEIGRGTSTFDGLSIAWSVAEYLHDLPCEKMGKLTAQGVKTIFATHYHELTDLANAKPRVKNYNIAVKEWNDEIIFLRKLIEGGTNRSYGIQVARLAGIPEKVIQRAKHVLARIEKGEHNLSAGLAPRDEKIARGKKPKQLSLFREPAEIILEKLNGIDISTMTPLDAMNLLSDLKEKAKFAV